MAVLRNAPGRFLGLALAAILIPACGKSASPPAPPPPPASLAVGVSHPSGTQSGLIPINYTISDSASLTCAIVVEFSTDSGNTYSPATSGPGGDGVAGLSSTPSPGTAHVFQWNSVADGVALGGSDSGVRIRITPSDTIPGAPGNTGNFTVNNDAHTAPSIVITTPAGTQGGLVEIDYFLVDADADVCSLQASFSTDGGTSFSPATAGPGGDGISNLSSSSGGGTAHAFFWNSAADGVAMGGPNSSVQVRLVPSDGQTGAAATTSTFTVNNLTRPSGSSIGGSWPIQLNPTGDSNWATAVAVDGTSLYTAGFAGFDFAAAAGADSSWRLEKRSLPTGALDAGFGSGGAILQNPGAGLDIPFKIVLDGGRMYVIGAQETGLKTQAFKLRVELRLVSDGSLVPSFGTAGVLVGPSAGGQDGIPLPWSAAVDGSFLYLAGSTAVSSSDLQWRIEKRDKLTGQLIPGFGSGGAVTGNPSNKVDGCFGLVIGAGAMWLAGAEDVDGTSASNGRIRLEKRSLLDGTLIAGFGSGGVVTADPGPGDDLAEQIVSDGASLFVYARVETALGSGLFTPRLEKRSLLDGSLSQPAVSGAAADPTGAFPCGHLAVEGGFLFVGAADAPADCRWWIEKRQLSDLSLVSTFGAAGIATSNPSTAYDRPLAVVARGGVLFLVGTDSVPGNEQWRLEARWR